MAIIQKVVHLGAENHRTLGKKKKLDKIFKKELLPHIDALKTFAYHLSYNEQDANDLVQETYMKAYRFIDKYQPGTNSKAWLFKILKNAFINAYRRKSTRPTQVDFEEAISYQESKNVAVGEFFDLRKELFDKMMGDEVTMALDNLPMDFKTVILLCDIEQFSYEEIAEILEIPIGTVRSRLFRARNMLKEKLKSYALSLGYEDKREARRQKNKSKEEE